MIPSSAGWHPTWVIDRAMIQQRKDLAKARRMVIKIGSSLLADANSGVQLARMRCIADCVADLHQHGKQVCLVSSGSVALGRVHLGWSGRALTVHEKQAAAAVGQPLLMRAWGDAFAVHGLTVAQMLLTKDDLRHRRRYLNVSNTSSTLFGEGVVPIVNENDTVAADEIKFGDNDALAALAALVIDADLLVLMTDVDGLHDANPRHDPQAKRLAEVREWRPGLLDLVDGQGDDFATGGMESKLKAARVALRSGVVTAMICGADGESLTRLLAGGDVGTLLYCSDDRQSHRRHWIAEVLEAAGTVNIDAGAARALSHRGGSLLPVGVVSIKGVFDKGDCVEVYADGVLLGRGLVNYTNEEVRQLIGVGSERIEELLGYVDYTSVIHRDNLVLLGERK
ncbi:MAG: glutamate 5-kinase [Mariprofundales bacterium]|nr:glutamate 5-kinase [Mariprofundales bacterium]